MLKSLRIVIAIIWILFAAFVYFLISLVRPFDLRTVRLPASFLGTPLFRVLGIKIRYIDFDLLNDEGPFLLIGNHQDNLDAFIYGHIVPKNTGAVGKKSLFWIPIFGQALWLGGHFLIDRHHHGSAMDTMKRVKETVLSKKANVFMMPEGTRSHGKGIGPFKKGPFRLAIETQIPIKMVVTSDIFKNIDLTKWNAGTLTMKVLPLIETSGLTRDDMEKLMESTRDLMISTFDELNKAS